MKTLTRLTADAGLFTAGVGGKATANSFLNEC
jgi:hypothetical protein